MNGGYEWRSGEDRGGDDGGPGGPLPDIPDAGDDSVPITPPDPIDFSTSGIAAAGAAGMSTFNDDDDRTLFERTADVFEEAGIDSPMLDPEAASSARWRTGIDESDAPRRWRARIY